jgi:hypothetical protein
MAGSGCLNSRFTDFPVFPDSPDKRQHCHRAPGWHPASRRKPAG